MYSNAKAIRLVQDIVDLLNVRFKNKPRSWSEHHFPRFLC